MKVLIVYGTKSGTTEKCVNELKKELNQEVELINLKKNNKINLNDYSFVVIGTPIYAGMIDSKVVKFCKNNEEILKNMDIAFYTCGLGDDNESLEALRKKISVFLLDKAKIISNFHGELHPENQGFFLRGITKVMLKTAKEKYVINYSKIKDFASKIKNS